MGVGSFINPYDFNHYQAHCLTFSASSCRYFEKAKKNSKTSPFALTSPKPELYNFLGWPEAPVFHIFKKPECTTVNKIALRIVKCLESWCYQKNLHGLGLSNVNKKWKIFSNCVAFWQYMNFMWLCSGPDLPEWNALKDQSIYIPMTMPVLLNKVIQWHCIQKIENESPLFQPQTEDSLLHTESLSQWAFNPQNIS